MRYAQRGGYTPAEQQRRERLRLEAAGRFARGDEIGEIARGLRGTEGSGGGGGRGRGGGGGGGQGVQWGGGRGGVGTAEGGPRGDGRGNQCVAAGTGRMY